MAAKAYILIETRVGQSREVLSALRAMENVVEADIITGNYDVIALAEADDMVALVDLFRASAV